MIPHMRAIFKGFLKFRPPRAKKTAAPASEAVKNLSLFFLSDGRRYA